MNHYFTRLIIIVLILILFAPALAMAAQDLGFVVETVHGLVSLATPIIAALALLFFFWGLAQYILSVGDEEKKSQGRSIMIWGIIALFVMVSVWGITTMIADTFGIQNPAITIPEVL
jgi:hypothetical protein